MRNCFVPNCDKECKQQNISKRMMFTAPKGIFDRWKKVLHGNGKREFRESDKVCERHFTTDQIITHWEHVIDGKLCQLEREKPKIKVDAIPTQYLQQKTAYTTVNQKSNAPSPTKRKSNEKMPKNSGEMASPKRKCVAKSKDELVLNEKDLQNGHEMIVESESTADDDQNSDSEAKQQIFETIYDDIYEVMLPSTLWGLHRDPDRKYISFTKFNVAQMACTKVLKVTDTFELTVYIQGKNVTSQTLHELNCEILSGVLNDLNESSE